jgi:hypothetical protein
MRTYNDAIECAWQIANRESQRDHYKSYVKTLIRALREDKVSLAEIIEGFLRFKRDIMDRSSFKELLLIML